jgi:hypothetical protein
MKDKPKNAPKKHTVENTKDERDKTKHKTKIKPPPAKAAKFSSLVLLYFLC